MVAFQNMLDSIGKCLQLMYSVKQECEKSVPKATQGTQPLLDMVSDHYSEEASKSNVNQNQIPNDISSISPNNASDRKADTSPERRTMRQTKSESSLSIDKQSPSNENQDDDEVKINRVMSKSSFELTTPTTEVASLNFETSVPPVENSSPRTNVLAAPTSDFTTHVTYAIASPVVGDVSVPYASYSSSDEEDVEFFDASEFSENSLEKKDETR